MDEEQNVAPAGDVLHDARELFARHDRRLLGGKVANHLQRADAVLARDLLEQVAGARCDPCGEGGTLLSQRAHIQPRLFSGFGTER